MPPSATATAGSTPATTWVESDELMFSGVMGFVGDSVRGTCLLAAPQGTVEAAAPKAAGARDWVGEQMLFLREGDKAQVTFHGERPVALDLPACVELTVAETDAAVRGAGATTQYKQATLETGLKVSVPEFIKAGETIAVDTRKVEYLGRAGK